MVKVVKFGGTSLAGAEVIQQVASIIREDEERRYVVLSAPGKRFKEDDKVTDLLIAAHEQREQGLDTTETFNKIEERFQSIVDGLGIDFDVSREIETIRIHMHEEPSLDYLASRGEYLNAKIFAAYMGWPFVDACDLIRFHQNKTLNESITYAFAERMLEQYDRAIIPGFYGAGNNGLITTFSRGGSDITGAIVARAVKADVYENWTDVNGFMSADPRIISDPKQIDIISYRELRELSYMGASVLHEDSIFPLRNTGIPILIKNTMNPKAKGTTIVSRYPFNMHTHAVTGIAGKKGFSNLQIEMAMMNSQIGFGAKVLQIIANNGISYEHTPTSIDIMSIIAETRYFDKTRNKVIMEIDEAFHPDRIFLEDGIALIAIVGEGISKNVGIAAKVIQCFADAKVNIRMIDAGCSELNIIVGVEDADYEKAIRALYDRLYEYF